MLLKPVLKLLDADTIENLTSALEATAKEDGVTKHIGCAVPLFKGGILLLKRIA